MRWVLGGWPKDGGSVPGSKEWTAVLNALNTVLLTSDSEV